MRFLVKASKWVLLLACVTACSPSTPPAPSAMPAKVSSSIHRVLQRMQADGVTAANAASRDVSSYANPLVRVDAAGRIHTAVWVTHLQDHVLVELRRLQMHIERTDARQGVVQGWVPFYRVADVAALSFVQHVRPPRYARGR